MTTVLVLGGARSGKSRYAEHLLARHEVVRYVAPGPLPDPSLDPEWAARVEAHRRSRPARWETVETGDVPAAIRASAGPVLVDCLGTWVTRLLDDGAAWGRPESAGHLVEAALGDLCTALGDAHDHVVLVSNETGWGVVPASASGRLFRDCLGRVNAAVADCCDRVVLVAAGRVLDLSAAPTVAAAPPLGLA